jgi:hypothetical protein
MVPFEAQFTTYTCRTRFFTLHVPKLGVWFVTVSPVSVMVNGALLFQHNCPLNKQTTEHMNE